MLTLECDNRVLVESSKYSYLITNYSSGVSTFAILNATDSAYAADAFLLLGNFGAEDAEIVKISSVNNNTGEIITTTATKFAHPESTRVAILPYNQLRFYHTVIDTFDIGTAVPLTGYIDLQPSDWFTTYNDESFSTGYGWYLFYNSVTTNLSQESNAIPYAGFQSDTTENILSDFFSMLSNKELKLVTREDALSWASEAYGKMRNKLNLTNTEFTASAITSLAILTGVTEYDLPTDFDHLIAFVSGLDPITPGSEGMNKLDITFIPLREAYSYTGSGVNGVGVRYYIRGTKIGILPTPTSDTTYHYMYNKKAARLNLNTDTVTLPNGGEYVIKDYMLYRAYKKFQNPGESKTSFDAFMNGLNDMIIASVKRDANLDTWGISKQANV